MISIMGKQWALKKTDYRKVQKLSIDYNFSYNLSNLIINRNFTDEEIQFTKDTPQIENILLKNKDFENASETINNCINNKDLTLIFGDYDVDGITSTSMLINFFNKINHPCYYIIPNRFIDGYGPNLNLLKKKIKNNTKTVIFVDCGTNSTEVVNYLNKKKITVLIIDHHQINKKLPSNVILLNPMKYKSKINICASILTFLLLKSFKNRNVDNDKYLILALLGSVCDLMPMRSTNRYVANITYKYLNRINNLGLNKLIETLALKRKISYQDLAFTIGPILNSSGRIDNADLAVELLISDNIEKIKIIVEKLIKNNHNRKLIENNNIKFINQDLFRNKKNAIFLYNKNFHEGIIGIIAGKLKEKYNLPSFIITSSNNILKGSARSTLDFNLNHLIAKLIQNKIIDKGGGHEQAAGFTLKCENLSSLKKFIDIEFSKIKRKSIYYYELKQPLLGNKSTFKYDLEKLAPFGNLNPEPLILFENLKVVKSHIIQGKHVFSILKNKTGGTIKSIAFDAVNSEIGNYLINFKKKFSLIGCISENEWNNKKNYQINIKDLII